MALIRQSLRRNLQQFQTRNMFRYFSSYSKTAVRTSERLTPLTYFGQRESLVDDIFLLSGKKYNTLFDPFSGSGSISFAAMQSKVANHYCINDSYPIIIALWNLVKKDEEFVVKLYSQLYLDFQACSPKQRIEFFKKTLATFNAPTNKDVDARAVYFAFLINHTKD